MARRPRLDGPATAHHVILRGIDGLPIFERADDRQDFVARLCRVLPESRARVFAWALLSNHVHLVVQTETGALSRTMRRLATGYAVRFNRTRERRGYVFMDRFHSRLVENDADLVGLIRYVHANPVAAGVVRSLPALVAYPWSGHPALIGTRAALPFEAVIPALQLFDDEPARARAELLGWMARSEGPADATPAVSSPPVKSPATPGAGPRPEPAPGVDLDALLRIACGHYRLADGALRSGSKSPRIARARAVVAYCAVVQLGQIGRVVASALGVSRNTISGAIERGRRAAREDGFELTARIRRI